MSTSVTNDKIIINFGWQGPSSWQGGWSQGGLNVGVIDLVFKNAKTEISVNIPENISPTILKKLPFTCRKYQETEVEFNGRKFKPLVQETHPELLKITIEQVHNLTIKAGIFEESPYKCPSVMDRTGKMTQERRVLRSDREVKLEVPQKLEEGQTYNLVVKSIDLSLSAHLVKEAVSNPIKTEKQPENDHLKTRINKMGEALLTEGLQNLNLAAKGGGGVFDSSTATTDIFAHIMKGVIRSGQHMHPEIRVPQNMPVKSTLDLDALSIDELQLRFQDTCKKDKEFESQRIQVAVTGNIEEFNKILEAELINTQLLIRLAEALEKKGVKVRLS